MEFDDLSPQERSLSPYHHIDPGLLNRRLCFSTFGEWLRTEFEKFRVQGNDHFSVLTNDHLIVSLVLGACSTAEVPSLGVVLARETPRRSLFCSTEKIIGNGQVRNAAQVRIEIDTPYKAGRRVFLQFHTRHIVSDTGRLRLATGDTELSIVAGIDRISEGEIVARPLIIGDPSYDHQFNREVSVDLMWHGWSWYEIFTHDIAEFRECENAASPSAWEWSKTMRSLSEAEVKARICDILGDLPKVDWAGEQDDHFAASLHIGDRRVTGAFLLKGPARFREMTPDMLGARADQIYRLSCTPADVLVVQHCHHIGEAVRAMLRAFAVTPHRPRHYCLIDGKDTYRVLKAYGKLGAAV